MRLFAIAVLAIALAACDPNAPTSDELQQQQQRTTTTQAAREVGMPAIINWSEKRQVKDLYELRDKMIPTWTYTQALDGRLVCVGQSIGFGIPYAVQYSNPDQLIDYEHTTMPQAEPNGLYMPNAAEGTWVQMLNPETKTVSPVYIEPRVTVSPFRLRGPVVARDCEG